MDRPPFSQTFVGAVLVAVVAGLVVWLLTGRPSSIDQRATHAQTVISTTSDRSTSAARPACVEAVINDPESYTNIRTGPSSKHEIVARVLQGEVFCVISQRDHWWKVRTATGIDGYMYYDRIRLLAASRD